MSAARALLSAAFLTGLAGLAVSGCRKSEPTRDPWFEDRAQEAGIAFRMAFLPGEQGEKFKVNFYDHGAGVAVADANGDGHDDVYFCNQLGPNALYLGDGKGRFSDVTAKAGVGLADRISVSAVFGDVDGDGDQDLYVTTTRGGNALFRNRGDGTFEDVTKAAGLELVAHSQAATFFDADGDGHLDLLVSNTARWTTDAFEQRGRYFVGAANFSELLKSQRESSCFYRNLGGGTFVDATAEAGLSGPGWAGDVTVFDFDGDGDADVFVSNMFGRSALYENDGKGRFRDVSKRALGRMSWGTVGSRAVDVDGDGRLDLFLVDMHSDMWMGTRYPPGTAADRAKFGSAFGPQVDRGLKTKEQDLEFAAAYDADPAEVVFGNTLFRNRGDGTFEEISDRAGVETLWPWGIASGDFDADGAVDAYLPSGMGYPYEYCSSPLLMNDGRGTFSDRAVEAGLEPPSGGKLQSERIGGAPATKSFRCAATADFDGDGRLDLIVGAFNGAPRLLMNRLPRRHFVEVRLQGTAGNRDALGAVVRLTVGGRTLVRQVEAATGYLSQSSKTLHFGLGDATKVDACEIRWPGGLVQPIGTLEIDRRTDLVEPKR